MNETSCFFARLKRMFWPAASCGLTLFSFFLFSAANPLQENITGIGWVNGRLWLMVLYCLYACLFCAFLSWKYFSAKAHPGIGQGLAFSWLVILAGSLLPWKAGEPEILALDLHSLLCTAAIAGQALCMIRILQDWSFEPDIKKTARLVLASLAVAFALFAWSQSISLLCEISYVNGYAWILSVMQVQQSLSSSSCQE